MPRRSSALRAVHNPGVVLPALATIAGPVPLRAFSEQPNLALFHAKRVPVEN